MYYSEKSFNVNVFYNIKLDDTVYNVSDIWEITIYCRNRNVDSTGVIADYNNIEAFLKDKIAEYNKLNDIHDNTTEENIAMWLCEQIVPCYKVKIKSSNGKLVIYKEDEI